MLKFITLLLLACALAACGTAGQRQLASLSQKQRLRGALITQTWQDLRSKKTSEAVRLTYDRSSQDCVEESRSPFNGPTLTRNLSEDHCRAFRMADAVAKLSTAGQCDSSRRVISSQPRKDGKADTETMRLGRDCLCIHETRHRVPKNRELTEIYELDYRDCVSFFPEGMRAQVKKLAEQMGYDL